MPRYTTAIVSTWSPERAFAYLSDFSNSQEWDPGVARARQLDSGPVAVGTEFDLVVMFAGRQKTLRYRVVEFEPARRVVFESSTAALRSVDTLTFSSRLGGCEVTYDADLRLTGAVALANPLLALFFRRIGNRARDSLHTILGAPYATR